MKKYLTLLIFAMLPLLLSATTTKEQALFDTANNEFSRKNYESALSGYKELFELGYDNFSITYNLGCCYYNMEELGLARYYFERAFIHSPFNNDLENSINTLIQKIEKDENATDEEIQIKRALLIFNPNLMFAIFVLLFTVAIVLTVMVIVRFNKRALIIAISALLFSLIIFVFTIFQSSVFNDIAITVGDTPIYLAPYSATVISNIPAGNKVTIWENENNYHMIKLSDSTNGWITDETIKIIRHNK